MQRLVWILWLLTAVAWADPGRELLRKYPLIDGHNDTPWQYRKRVNSDLDSIDLSRSTAGLGMQTDLPRLRKGGLGAQFWSIYLPNDVANPIQAFRNQLALARRLVARYPDLEQALEADDIVRIHRQGRIASLYGLEGGHALGGDVAQLRVLYGLGARYLTLTHTRSNELADSSEGPRLHGGLSKVGRQAVAEMNRLGMLIDLSHVSDETMRDVLELSTRPVVFTHSNVRALCNHERNVPDDVLLKLRANGGVIMVSFVPSFVSEEVRTQRAQRATLGQVADHIDYLKGLIGVDHIGIGSDFDGIDRGPVGLEDVSRYPALVNELLKRGYSEQELAKILGANLLRVLRAQTEGASG